jgi:hypothetical protein
MSDIDSEKQTVEPRPESEIGLPESLGHDGLDLDKEMSIEAAVAVSPAVIHSPPPNGGTVAWLQVLGTFFLWFASL